MRNLNGNILFLILVSVGTSISQVLMRWGGKTSAELPPMSPLQWLWHSRWWIVGIVAGWFCGLAYAWLLRKIPLTIAWPVSTGLIYTLVIVLSFALLHEKLKPVQMCGVVLIFVGIIMVCAQK